MFRAVLRNLPDAVIDTADSKAELKRRCTQIHKLNIDAVQIEEV